MAAIMLVLFSCLLGSIPTAHIAGQVFKGIDIGEVGGILAKVPRRVTVASHVSRKGRMKGFLRPRTVRETRAYDGEPRNGSRRHGGRMMTVVPRQRACLYVPVKAAD